MTTDVGQSKVEYWPAGVLRNDVGALRRGSSRQSRGRQKRGAEVEIQIERFFPAVGALSMAFFSLHGNASYTRCCNGAVYPLVGDVIGVTEVRKLRFCCAIWSAGAGG